MIVEEIQKVGGANAVSPVTMVKRPKGANCVDATAAVLKITFAIVRRGSASARNDTAAINAINVKCVFMEMAVRRANEVIKTILSCFPFFRFSISVWLCQH